MLTSHVRPASCPPLLSLLPAPSDLLLADSKAAAIKRVKSAGTLGDHGGGAGELVLRFFAKTAVLVVSVFILSDHAERIPRLALEYLYGKRTVLCKGSCTSRTMSVRSAVAAMLSSDRALLSFVYCQHFTQVAEAAQRRCYSNR